MALRIKSHWHNDNLDRSLEEIGNALAFNAWRLAKDKAIGLHGADFIYKSDEQRLGVILEFLVFQVQILDRTAMLELGLDDEARRELIVSLVRNLAKHVQDNGVDLLGPGNHGGDFIERLNQRAQEYAEFSFDQDGPSYPFLRHLGHEIQQLMGEDGENRWVIDKVMDQDGPDLSRKIMRTLRDLAA
jgi:hypothetical protein